MVKLKDGEEVNNAPWAVMLPGALRARMKTHEEIKWSVIIRESITNKIAELEKNRK